MIYFKQKGGSSGSSILNKFDATVAPTANDDSGDGYAVGSLWIDITAKEAYRCVDATEGAAVWLNTTVEITDLGDIVMRDADEFAGADHNHDEDYSALGHNHDEDYSALGHNHDEDYSALGHNHDEDYSALGHNHDEDYSALGHNHDEDYANKVVVDEYDDPTGCLVGLDAAGDMVKTDSKPADFASSDHTHDGMVTSDDVSGIVVLTQAEYDLLSPPDEYTLYVIVE